MGLESMVVGTLRSRPVTGLARLMTRGRLRILAYHGVPDAGSFAAQMEYLASAYTPVHEDDVADAIHRGGSLPPRAAWVTFDDGDPTVVTNGLPTLERLGIPATMFVCPGLIEADEPFWWRLTDWAMATMPDRTAIFHEGDLTEYVKTVTDGRRREIVTTLLAEAAAQQPLPADWRQLSDDELARWTRAGMALGNHSWDHPCLDMCGPDLQREQIQRTHGWLADHLGRPPRSFAYPNGNFSEVVDAEVASLGYDVGVMYDNRLADLGGPPLRLSRLMLEADQPAARLTGVLSGAQPALRALATKLGA